MVKGEIVIKLKNTDLLKKSVQQGFVLQVIKERIIAGSFVGNEAVEMINFVLQDETKIDIPVIQDSPLDEDRHIITA